MFSPSAPQGDADQECLTRRKCVRNADQQIQKMFHYKAFLLSQYCATAPLRNRLPDTRSPSVSHAHRHERSHTDARTQTQTHTHYGLAIQARDPSRCHARLKPKRCSRADKESQYTVYLTYSSQLQPKSQRRSASRVHSSAETESTRKESAKAGRQPASCSALGQKKKPGRVSRVRKNESKALLPNARPALSNSCP
jgi:hypothetical protein